MRARPILNQEMRVRVRVMLRVNVCVKMRVNIRVRVGVRVRVKVRVRVRVSSAAGNSEIDRILIWLLYQISNCEVSIVKFC
jgi:hypothetical protein